MSITRLLFAVCTTILVIPSLEASEPMSWRSNYRAGVAEARTCRAMALVWFFDPDLAGENGRLEARVFGHPDVQKRQDTVVPIRLPVDAPLDPKDSRGLSERLLDHPAFAELLRGPGIALIDYRDSSSEHYGRVVSVYPAAAHPINPVHLALMLDLPAGSLTQRTLIWAVRIHSERPQSASGEACPLLSSEAASHARHQAALNHCGHHDWESRFHRINARLPAHLVAQEICAESWPNQPLVAAARDCVSSWRQSSGHWDAVHTGHPLFGYDMCRGTNGVWYAVGIFGRRRR